MEIDGPAAGLTIAGGGSTSNFTPIEVYSGVSATLRNVTVTGGHAAAGGSIENLGTLAITNDSIKGNWGGYGGGIDNLGTLTVANSTVAGNQANYGGGIYNATNAVVTIMASTLSGNSASSDGGGVDNANGSAAVIDSTFAGNTSATGGGIENYYYGLLTVTSSTLSGNSATGVYGGGGIYNWGAVANSGAATLNNTIVAGNTTVYGGADFGGYPAASSSSHDLLGTGGSSGLSAVANGNLVGVSNAGLAPLGNYGGPTQTMPLLPGSPALDRGLSSLNVDTLGHPLTTDQRGMAPS